MIGVRSWKGLLLYQDVPDAKNFFFTVLNSSFGDWSPTGPFKAVRFAGTRHTCRNRHVKSATDTNDGRRGIGLWPSRACAS